MNMLIGVDFDNTIVCYDELFHQVAAARGLIPAGIPARKNAVRDHLRRAGQEDLWTELQGLVYGPEMREARPFPGVLECFTRCSSLGIQVRIISHRTRHPYLGEPYDLHQSARQWLAARGFCDPARLGLRECDVFLELTRQDKLARIAETGCTHFIDDLPEFLSEAGFPAGVERILFDPGDTHRQWRASGRATSWAAMEKLLFGESL
jgi:hypothetical protein